MTQNKESASNNNVSTPNNSITLAQLINSLRALGINVSSGSAQQDASSQATASSSTASTTSSGSASAAPSALTLEALMTALSTLGLEVAGPTSPAAASPTTTTTTTSATPTIDTAASFVLTGGTPRISPLSGGTRPVIPPQGSEAEAPRATTDLNTGVISGFVCASCNTHNLLRPARETWYVITVGRQVGVFQGWHIVQPLVSAVSGACYRKYPSREEALAAFNEALAMGNVQIIAPPAPPS
ncbi:hypothetical protein DFP72DRAFT_848771 [Ephemerocybe angulata]|uniref:Ribonuclease H1 N-terminal domain-containing protein n=1 Tax=Ephemerocybe angulata TaxID=980116 RepID=A0A8H6HWZ1_9AGAR|nr:hypothetical protein DFP72DRAFT_848771 [Tulosesus angulatus]